MTQKRPTAGGYGSTTGQPCAQPTSRNTRPRLGGNRRRRRVGILENGAEATLADRTYNETGRIRADPESENGRPCER